MTIEEHIKYWLESAEYDLESSIVNYEAGRYTWCLFIGHLALEKVLKGLYVQNNSNSVPPKIHNLIKLANLSSIEITPGQAKLFASINKFQIEARYIEHKNELYKIADKNFTYDYLQKIKEQYIWLKSKIK
ncbi:HEPN domain-containing protein [Bacteroidota bacterium]